MSNKSIKQIHSEIERARREALRDPHRYEREDSMRTGSFKTGARDGNRLSDMVSLSVRSCPVSRQAIPVILREKIESLFVKFPSQYKYLGLYYAGDFTLSEISDMEGVCKQVVSKTLRSAVKRLKKYLTQDEYASIRWAIRERIPMDATPRLDDSGYENTKSSFVPTRSVRIDEPLSTPVEKSLPVTRAVEW